jgi:hypothetical protein
MRKSFQLMLALPLLIAAIRTPSLADSYTYTFVGAGDIAGTNFTLVDPSGPLDFSLSTNLAPLITTSTDYFGPNGGVDNGSINQITIGLYPTNDLPWLSIGNTNCCSLTGFLLGLTDLSNPGTYEYYPDIPQNNWGTMTISSTPAVAVPEPSSVALMLTAAGLFGLMIVMRRRTGLRRPRAS